MNREPSGSQFVRTQLTTLDLTRNQTVTKWNHGALSFAKCRRRRVRANSSGGSISPNGGALLSHEVDRQLGLTDRVARAVGDRRPYTKVRHEVVTMVRQRVHEAALGYEYLNDHDALRHDEAVQTACERDAALASASTLCRAERSRTEPGDGAAPTRGEWPDTRLLMPASAARLATSLRIARSKGRSAVGCPSRRARGMVRAPSVRPRRALRSRVSMRASWQRRGRRFVQRRIEGGEFGRRGRSRRSADGRRHRGRVLEPTNRAAAQGPSG